MPHSLEYKGCNVSDDMTYLGSRRLTADEATEADRWMGEQLFKDEVVCDATLWTRSLDGDIFWIVGAWFKDGGDMAMFKLAWG
jgi:hypothetical protein